MMVMEYTREEVASGLKSAIATVVFEKADGTLRTMRCTLMESYLPEATENKTGRKKAHNDEVVSVWDLENGGWRSFRLDSIQSLSYSPVEGD
jgi:hypothetical protein